MRVSFIFRFVNLLICSYHLNVSLWYIGKVSSVFLEDINKGVAEIYTNQHNIENAAKSLQTQTAIFSK